MTDKIDISKLPAFPVTMTGPCEFAGIDVPQGGTVQYGGMTLRDYFAAKAMQEFIRNFLELSRISEVDIKRVNEIIDKCPLNSYEMADAMIEARG